LAYERRAVWAGAPDLGPNAGRIWLLEVDEGAERPLFEYDVALHSPVWSPTGEHLAYISPMVPGVEVLHVSSGELQQFGNEWGAEPVWSPDGEHLVVPELMLAGEQFVVRLSRFDLESEALVDISGDAELVRDESPAWSPGGGWIAFGRQFLTDDRWTVGRQIWLTRPDASEAYALTDRPLADHFGLDWRPDGGALVYAVDDLSEGPQSMPTISLWVFDFSRGEAQQVTQHAVEPKWLP
jgi:Tol biopolymer transport system component